MAIQGFKFLIIIVFQLNFYSNAIDFDEGCSIGDKAMLQVAFTIDYTGTFWNRRNNSFYWKFADLIPTLFAEIDKDYPGSQFALSVHADWNYDARPPSRPKVSPVHNNTEGCYTRLVPFTTNTTDFRRRMLNIGIISNGAQENGLSALAFTAADPRLGWIRNATAPNGKPVRRVLILVTDEDDLLLINRPRRRQEFKGDGTDSCSSSKPPTHKILKDVFEKYQMTVLALLAVTQIRPKVEELYAKHFEEIGSSILYCGKPFALRSRSKGIQFADMKSTFKVPEGFWSGEEVIEEGEILNDSPQATDEDINRMAAEPPKARAGEYDELITFVKDCLKKTDTKSGCLFGDPEGFNTLGF